MKNIKFFSVFLSILLVCVVIPQIFAEEEFESGSGTSSNPYIIKTGKQLQNINNYCGEKNKDVYFEIDKTIKSLDMSNIDFDPLCELKEGEDSNSFTNAFYGHFNGNNVEITNLVIDTDKIAGGLFSATNKAQISNVGIDSNSNITTNGKSNITNISPTGAIVGEASNTKITNVWNKANINAVGTNVGGIVGKSINNSKVSKAYNTGNINAGLDSDNNSYIGGIIGYAIDSTISDSYNTATINSDGKIVGGIVGELIGKSKITNSYNTGDISSRKDDNESGIVGGIIGKSDKESNSLKLEISKVYNSGNISSTGSNVGGIIGENSNESEINDIYNTGNINSNKDNVGGLIGISHEKITIQNAFNYNEEINGTNNIGAILGYIENDQSSIKNVYYLKEGKELSAYGNSLENLTTENIKSYSKEDLSKQSTYIGFDFDKIWTMGNNYPEINMDDEKEEEKPQTSDSDLPQVTIKYNDEIIDIENFLYNDGRTFVDLSTFCKKTDICSAKLVKETYEITRNKKLDDNTDSEYTYLVEHKPNSKEFKASIIIGGRKIVDDENSQTSTDVTSCPEDVEKYKCTNEKLYVPLRFLTQALGLRVEWDGENSTVNIKNTFEEEFFNKYDVNITEGQCDDDVTSCKVLEKNNDDEYELEEDKTYYITVSDKETNEVKKFSKYFSFYETIDQEGEEEPYTYTSSPFQITSNSIKLSNNEHKSSNIAQVIIYKIESNENFNSGSYPFVIDTKFTKKKNN